MELFNRKSQKTMISKIFKLVRLPNLLIVALTQYLMRWAILNPLLIKNGYELQFGEFNFFLLVLTTVLLTAGGYIINDYFDTKTDLLNRPKTVVVGNFISRKQALKLHIILNSIALVLGFYISFQINLFKLGFIFLLISGILWYYSSSYKRQFLIGNLIVAILTAMVTLMPVLFEIPVLNAKYMNIIILRNSDFYNLFFWSVGFAGFAFLTTLFREIIKDIEDYEGDNVYGRNTVPIILGIKYSKIIVISLVIFTLISMYFVYFKYINNITSLIYIVCILTPPQLMLIYRIFKANEKNDYHKANILSKIIMLLGVMYSFIALFNF